MTERAHDRSSSSAASASTPGGPNVLESVLAKITQEYERRLLTKESELVRARETLSEAYKREGRLTQQAEELRARVARWDGFPTPPHWRRLAAQIQQRGKNSSGSTARRWHWLIHRLLFSVSCSMLFICAL